MQENEQIRTYHQFARQALQELHPSVRLQPAVFSIVYALSCLSAYCACNLIPNPLHRPFQVRYISPIVFFTHGSPNVYDIDSGFLVRHPEKSAVGTEVGPMKISCFKFQLQIIVQQAGRRVISVEHNRLQPRGHVGVIRSQNQSKRHQSSCNQSSAVQLTALINETSILSESQCCCDSEITLQRIGRSPHKNVGYFYFMEPCSISCHKVNPLISDIWNISDTPSYGTLLGTQLFHVCTCHLYILFSISSTAVLH